MGIRGGSFCFPHTLWLLLCLIPIGTSWLPVNVFAKDGLSLDDYLNQVKQENFGLKAFELQERGATATAGEADLALSPQLFTEYHSASDEAPPNNPGFSYSRIESQKLSLGLQQEFSFGLKGKISHSLNKINYVDGRAGGQSFEFNNWDASPSVELSWSVWRNFAGRETQARRSLILFQSDKERLGADLGRTQILLDAEATYWALASAQASLRIQKESFRRSEALLEFIEAKARQNLRDRSDVLQTRASLESSRLELQRFLNQVGLAQRAFNRLRGAALEMEIPDLDALNFDPLSQSSLPETRPGSRLDLNMSRIDLSLAQANHTLKDQATRPELTVFASYSLTGRDEEMFESASKPYSGQNPTQVFGVRFSLPLDRSAVKNIQDGIFLKKLAVENSIKQIQYDQDSEWRDLWQRFSETQENLKLIRQIVTVQREKLQEEQRQLRLGRASLFNVLSFEQDALRSELTQIQLALELKNLKIRSQIFKGPIHGEGSSRMKL